MDTAATLIAHERWFNVYRHTVTGPFPDQATADHCATLDAQLPAALRRIGPARRIVFTPVGFLDCRGTCGLQGHAAPGVLPSRGISPSMGKNEQPTTHNKTR